MRLFLQIEIGPGNPNLEGMPLVHFASSLSSDLMGTEINNESDYLVAETIIKMIDQADQVFLLVSVNDPLAQVGRVSLILNYLLKDSDSEVEVVLRGSHEAIETLTAGYENKLTRVKEEEEIKRLIRNFAQTS